VDLISPLPVEVLRDVNQSFLLLLNNWVVTASQQATKLVRQNLPLVKPCWLSPFTSLSSMCLSIASRRICSMTFPGTEVRLMGRSFSGSSFLTFHNVSLFPVSGDFT